MQYILMLSLQMSAVSSLSSARNVVTWVEKAVIIYQLESHRLYIVVVRQKKLLVHKKTDRSM